MKAAVCNSYGPPEVLKIKDMPKPHCNQNQVCIRIYSSAVTASDIFLRGSNLPILYKIPMRLMMGIRRPRRPILGLVFAGEIESVGAEIKNYSPGDKVYGLSGFSQGCYAEYLCLKEKPSTLGCLAPISQNLSYEQATAVAYGGLLALQYLEKGTIKPGDQVLIYGASGTSGTIAVQMAKHLGAEVTAVCSAANADFVKSLGADYVLDYTKQNTPPSGKQYDFMLDAVGRQKTSALKVSCKKALKPKGIYSSIDDGALKLSANRLKKITELTEAGILKPVLDRTYKLDEIVEAHRYVEQGHKRGGVAIKIP